MVELRSSLLTLGKVHASMTFRSLNRSLIDYCFFSQTLGFGDVKPLPSAVNRPTPFLPLNWRVLSR